MHHRLLCIGHKAPSWVAEGEQSYLKRLRPALDIQLLTPSKASDANQRKQAEAKRVEEKLPKHAWLVALDEGGRQFNSRQLAQQYKFWLEQARPLVFLIGGADGLDASLRDRANATWSLSPLTLPHALVRIFLVESLYRSQSVLAGHPYHRD